MIYERHGKRLQFSGTNRGTYKWQLSQDNKKCHPLSNKLKKTHLKIWELPQTWKFRMIKSEKIQHRDMKSNDPI